MNTDITERLKDIKRSFRLMMDGVSSKSMRDKGIEYHLNWGVPFPMLKSKAAEIGKDYDLAIALWKENVRECKILATLVMPAEKMLPEVVDIWMEQTTSVEIAEMASFNLYQYLPFATEKAYGWIASDSSIYQLCGFHVFSRLFFKGMIPDERGINEYIDQLSVVLQGEDLIVKKAAMASVLRFAALGDVYESIVQNALHKFGIELF